jgi:hypothetical protein
MTHTSVIRGDMAKHAIDDRRPVRCKSTLKNMEHHMKGWKQLHTDHRNRFKILLHSAIAVAACFCTVSDFSTAHAQSTAASIFGWGPAGQTVKVQSTSGMHRHATVNDKGRYNIHSLPLGTYTVTLEKDGKAVDTRRNIPLAVGRSAEIDFACVEDKCAK